MYQHGRPASGLVAVVAVLALRFAGTASAHTGTTHAGTPHWVLLAMVLLGLGAATVGWRGFQRGFLGGRSAAGVLTVGLAVVALGGIGLVEIQIVPRTAPGWTDRLGTINLVVGSLLAVGSLVACRRFYPRRPRYAVLGFLLSAWIAYPALFPTTGLGNPLGYAIALGVPVTVAYVVASDAADAVRRLRRDALARRFGAVAFVGFSVFFSFSTGALTVNPDTTPAIAGERILTIQRVASPLVYWPAVEFYLPSVPVAGYVSLGTLLLLSLLGGLVALNAGLASRNWAARDDRSSRAALGTVAASGATACCCCAPALYGVVGAVLGTAASPVYWAFMDPTSPVGGLFFAASVSLLTGAVIRAASDPACAAPTAAGA